MVQQYLRNVRMQIEGGKTFDYDGEKNGGQGLRIRFDVHQRDSSTPNYANIYIYNLAPSSQQPALIRDKTVTLWAGYGQQLQLIFKGQIKQARANVRENPADPDTMLAILATDMGTARNYAVVNKTLPEGHTHMDRAQVALDAMKGLGVEVGHIATQALSAAKFSRPFSCFGMAKDLLRQTCGATKTSFSIQNGKAQILENDKGLPGGAIVLKGDTGLIGLPVQTIQGIEGVALLNAQIRVGCLVQIDRRLIQQSAFSPNMQFGNDGSSGPQAVNGLTPTNYYLDEARLAVDGIYKVFVAEHLGDSRGNEFYTTFVAVRNGALPNPALATRLVPTPSN